ncbi:MAG: putative manganese-dependent inorganic diphosphatase [Lachnospiraceae bacterium]|nr:putative manganese-dependent inorganic diphosphatase [Lachnospiraceae bacterium]
MSKKVDVWVMGHKNPDTDSVCAAISYAYLKNQIDDKNYIPKKAGDINSETSYVLKRFDAQIPETVTDVGTQIKDIELRHTKGVSDHYSLKKAWELMRTEDVVTLPIVGNNDLLTGVIVNGDIAYSYMDVYDNRELSRARTQYKNIIETLQGHMICGNDHGYFVKGKVVVASGSRETFGNDIDEDDLVIMGNIKERQLIAIENKPSCLIVTDATIVDPEIIEKCDQIQCVLITTEFDCFTTARLINQSMPIKHFMTKKNLITFDLDDYVDDVREAMSGVRHRDFPVLDENRKYVGMFSRRNLLNMQKKKVILVDHNEKTQAVDGIEQAEILEIIDHHKIGSLETIQPIYFRNQPLGCSSTIIYQMFEEKGVEVPPKIAGLLLSAILSDTLMFRSPTCTEVDKKVGAELAKIAEVDYEELALHMFEAGSDFGSKTIDEIFYQDFKIFHAADKNFAVAQISAVSKSQLDGILGKISDYMNTVLVDKNLDMVYVMLTNIIDQSTELLYSGKDSDSVVVTAFGEEKLTDRETMILPGVVSRKKQLIPPIMEALQQ